MEDRFVKIILNAAQKYQEIEDIKGELIDKKDSSRSSNRHPIEVKEKWGISNVQNITFFR